MWLWQPNPSVRTSYKGRGDRKPEEGVVLLLRILEGGVKRGGHSAAPKQGGTKETIIRDPSGKLGEHTRCCGKCESCQLEG